MSQIKEEHSQDLQLDHSPCFHCRWLSTLPRWLWACCLFHSLSTTMKDWTTPMTLTTRRMYFPWVVLRGCNRSVFIRAVRRTAPFLTAISAIQVSQESVSLCHQMDGTHCNSRGISILSAILVLWICGCLHHAIDGSPSHHKPRSDYRYVSIRIIQFYSMSSPLLSWKKALD